MRPQGEVRAALFAAMREGPATARVLAARACVGLEAARRTLDNMVRADQVVKPHTTRVPGVKRPVPVYAAVVPAAEPGLPLALLQGGMWAQLMLPLFADGPRP